MDVCVFNVETCDVVAEYYSRLIWISRVLKVGTYKFDGELLGKRLLRNQKNQKKKKKSKVWLQEKRLKAWLVQTQRLRLREFADADGCGF